MGGAEDEDVLRWSVEMSGEMNQNDRAGEMKMNHTSGPNNGNVQCQFQNEEQWAAICSGTMLT